MNLPLFLASPGMQILFKWTCLLALGWVAHWVLHRRHARWRLILWRGILCFSLALPLFHFFQVPGLKIPIAGGVAPASDFAGSLSPVAAGDPIRPAASVASPARAPGAAGPFSGSLGSFQSPASPNRISWKNILLGLWILGGVCGTARLVALQIHLARLRNEACRPSPELQRQANQIQARLKVRREIEVQISDAVTSPFVCGLLKPAIILPRTLAQRLSPGEVAALLSHEIAHLRRHDLVWCVAWQWMKAVCWFHPFVWPVPAAHNLACEQEADRVASGQLADQDFYARLLARLALRVLALPAVETKLTLNGSSQIARRLNQLGRKKMDAWNWTHSVAGFGLVGLLFLMTAGCEFSKTVPANPKVSTPVEFKQVLVVVQDEDGKPIAGATILPTGFRVKGIHGADAYGWNNKLFGPPEKAVTDAEGKAYVKYPVEGIPDEKEFTGQLIFGVSHPEFASVFIQSYSVDSSEDPIRLTHGILLEISGYFGADHQPVTDLVPNLTEGVHPEDWQKQANGVFVYPNLSPGGHLLQLMGRLPSGEIVYSDARAFTAEKGMPCRFALEMKPGIRLEGRIDDQVPRPVKNGRVMIDVRPGEYPALDVIDDYYDADKKYGGRHFWHSYRPINEDGTFVFESIPPGEADVVVLGDGFASKTIGQLQNRVNGTLAKGPVMAIPQAFPLVAPVTQIEVTTEPTATLELTATTPSGKPIEGVWVGMYPSVFRMWGMFGWLKKSSEEPYREMPQLPDPVFSGQTDENGKLVIQNLPAETHGMEVNHPQFQVPLQQPNGWRDRHVRAAFVPGTTNKMELTLEPKGADFIGSPGVPPTSSKDSFSGTNQTIANHPAGPVDLTARYTTPISWFEHITNFPAFKTVPRGFQVFRNVPLQIEGMICLWGEGNATKLHIIFPEQILGIEIGQKFETLYIYHAAFFQSSNATPVCQVVFRYEDGSSLTNRMLYGNDVLDWVANTNAPVIGPTGPNSTLAWVGGTFTPGQDRPLRLCLTAIQNPQPSLEVKTIDLYSCKSRTAPCIMAMTTGRSGLLKRPD